MCYQYLENIYSFVLETQWAHGCVQLYRECNASFRYRTDGTVCAEPRFESNLYELILNL